MSAIFLGSSLKQGIAKSASISAGGNLTCKEFGKARTFKKGVAKLRDFCYQFDKLHSLSVVYSTDLDLAIEFSDSLSSLLEDSIPIIGRIGPVTGTHSGPGTLGVGLVPKI